jgi:hypothetical protein
MNVRRKGATFRSLLAIVCMLAVVPGDTLAVTSSAWQATASSPQSQTPKTPPEQLDSLVAPLVSGPAAGADACGLHVSS